MILSFLGQAQLVLRGEVVVSGRVSTPSLSLSLSTPTFALRVVTILSLNPGSSITILHSKLAPT